MVRYALAQVVLAAVVGGGPLAAAGQQPRASFTLRADWFDRGNVRISLPGESYADKYPCIWNAGQLPNQAEYEVDFPVTAEYQLVALYTAASARPVEIHLDGQKIHLGFASVTGTWQTSGAQWERQTSVHVTAGKHTLRLLCPGPCMPHICGLRFESPVAFPEGWKLARRVPRAASGVIEPLVPPAHRLLAIAEQEPQAELRAAALDAAAAIRPGPAERDELLRDSPAGGQPQTPWVGRITLERPGQAAETELLPLAAARVRRMLEHATWLIDDYRTQAELPRDYLESSRAPLRALTAELDTLDRQADGVERAARLLQLHLAAFRLESQIVRSNPLLDFERLLVVRRSVASPRLGLPQNWQSNCVLPASGFDDQIAVLSPLSPAAPLTTLYRPSQPVFVGDVDLHFDAERLLFSSLGTHGRWQIFEIGTDGSGLRQVTPGEHADVNNYDACYLPDERIVFSSTASMAAVPCVNGSTRVANLYRMDADGRNIRQLCFDQEHNWCPTMLPNGRVLYLRWEYTDTPHSHDRVLFQMNPDGTGQMEYYGSNSYWPNSLFYARPIPGQPTQFVGIVGGHHGVPRMGELVLFDVARGRREADGAIQRIPGHGQPVEAIIADNLVDASWPKFLHPFPLNERYFLVAAQQTPQSLWGIYLVDVFDGMTLLREEPGYALLEPVPLRPTPRPPVIPDRVDLSSREGIVYLSDIYAGDGLAGVPRGAVKQLRVLSYHYLYPGMGGPQGVIGMEGPWDIKRILGTVPVEADGSAVFRVPANTPISLQPLDEEGKALQLMRSWLTAMPGEVLSCVGCHESQSSGPPSKRTLASTRRPSEIAPWHGPPRGFNFAREVQPVLDRYCVGCHDGQVRPDGTAPADLRGLEKIAGYTSKFHFGAHDAGHFSTSYAELHRYVRRPGLESDYHLLTPLEYHADTTRLVQLLRKGHFGVQLDAEAWDRLITWIDLNAPYHGTWIEIAGEARVRPLAQRRRELLRQYAGLDVDFEAIYPPAGGPVTPVIPAPPPFAPAVAVRAAGWPFDAAEAQRRQTALGWTPQTVEVGNEVSLELVAIPPGEFVMGDDAGYDDERPRTVVRIERPFWIGRCEVTNEQFAQFDPSHDSRVESKHAMQFGVRGFYVNGPKQPVVRVSWEQATAFCQWLSAQTGRRFALPTEAQWEYACRAGAETPFSFGDRTADFSPHANMADLMLREVVCDPYNKARAPFANPGPYDDWIPKDERYSDGGFVSEDVGRWLPNAWGLCEMHGNVSEWTRSAYRPYPYDEHDGRNDAEPAEPRVARGGSWRDCPADCRAACRFPYRSYQPVYNVGFRIVCEEQ